MRTLATCRKFQVQKFTLFYRRRRNMNCVRPRVHGNRAWVLLTALPIPVSVHPRGKSDTSERSSRRRWTNAGSPRSHSVSTASEINRLYFSRSNSHQRRVISCRLGRAARFARAETRAGQKAYATRTRSGNIQSNAMKRHWKRVAICAGIALGSVAITLLLATVPFFQGPQSEGPGRAFRFTRGRADAGSPHHWRR